MVIMAMSLLTIPHVDNLPAFGVLYVLLSIGIGGFVTGQAAWMITIWKEKAYRYIRVQDFFFALGCVIPSVLYAPFLSDEAINEAHSHLNTSWNLDDDPSEEMTRLASAAQLYIPTLTCGVIVAIGAMGLFVVIFVFRRTKQWSAQFDYHHQSHQSSIKSNVSGNSLRRISLTQESNQAFSNSVMENKQMEVTADRIGTNMRKIVVLALATVFIGAFESIETVMNHYLVVYARYSHFNLSQARGARLLSACGVAYAFTRITGTLTLSKIDPRISLIADITTVALADIWLLAVGPSGNMIFLLAGTIMVEVGFATSIPTFFLYLQRRMKVTDSVASVLLVGGACVAAMYPAFMGSFIEDHPDSLLYVTLGTAAMATVSLFLLMVIVRGVKE